jgi:hypothetical protein
MNDNPIVIGATIADLPAIMRLLRIMWAEGGMFPLDENCAREMFERVLKNKEGVIGTIKGPDGELRAMMYLLITRFWYTQEFHLEEIYSFVDPNFRKSNYANALLKYAKHSSDTLGIPLIIGVLSNERMATKVRLYRRELGIPSGAFFVYNAHWVNEKTNPALWNEILKEKETVPKGAWVVPYNVLCELGNGDSAVGRGKLESFISRSRNPGGATPPQWGGTVKSIGKALASSIATTAVLPRSLN